MQFQGYQGMSGGTLPPGILDTMTSGARIGAANIRAAGQSVGGMIEKFAEERKAREEQEKNDAKMAKALRTIAPLMTGPDGSPLLSKEQADTMGGKELQTLLAVAASASTLAAQQAQMRRYEQQAREEALSRERQQRVAGLIGGATQGEDPLNTFKLAALASGGDHAAMQLVNDYMRANPAQDPLDQSRVELQRRNLDLQERRIKLGENPPAKPPEQPRVNIVRDPLTGEDRVSVTLGLDEAQKRGFQVPGLTGNKPAAGAVEDAPRDAAKRKANTVYNTPKGPLLWTGTGWRQP